jgi:hypothetical protein
LRNHNGELNLNFFKEVVDRVADLDNPNHRIIQILKKEKKPKITISKTKQNWYYYL